MSTFAGSPRAGLRRRRLLSEWWRRPQSQQLIITASGCAIGLVLAYVLVHRSWTQAFALPLLVLIAWLMLRRDIGILVGIAVILCAPSWDTVGTSQVSVLRLASLAAVSTVLFTRRRLRLNAVDAALLLLLAVLIAGWVLQDDNVPHSGRVLVTELTPLGFYVGVRALSAEAVSRLFVTVLLAGTVGALTVIYEYLKGYTVFLNPTTYQWDRTETTIFRPGGVFGGPPQASTVLCVVILLGFAAVTRLRGWAKWGAIGCIGVCLVAEFLTFTRGGLVALGIGTLLYLWLTRSRLMRPVRLAWLIGACLLTSLVVIPQLHKSTSLQEGLFRSGTLQAREGYWSTAAPIATSSIHNFVFGIGTVALEIPALSDSVTLSEQVAIRPQVYLISLHSEYVTIMIENGALGIAALALFMLIPMVRAGRAALKRRDHQAAAVTASLAAIAIVMTVNTVLLDGASFAVTLVCAGLAGISTQRARPSASIRAERTTPFATPLRWWAG